MFTTSESTSDYGSAADYSFERQSAVSTLVPSRVATPIPVMSPATVMSRSRTSRIAIPPEMNPEIVNLLARICQWGSWAELVQVENTGYRMEFSVSLSLEEGDIIFGLASSDRALDSDEEDGDPGSDRGEIVDFEGNLD